MNRGTIDVKSPLGIACAIGVAIIIVGGIWEATHPDEQSNHWPAQSVSLDVRTGDNLYLLDGTYYGHVVDTTGTGDDLQFCVAYPSGGREWKSIVVMQQLEAKRP